MAATRDEVLARTGATEGSSEHTQALYDFSALSNHRHVHVIALIERRPVFQGSQARGD